MSAGARLMVTFLGFVRNPELRIAVRILSRLSLMALSGRPTTMNEGSPAATLISTVTFMASMPMSAAAESVVSMVGVCGLRGALGACHCPFPFNLHYFCRISPAGEAGKFSQLSAGRLIWR